MNNSKNKQIADLFASCFEFDNFEKKERAKSFKCPNMGNCQVRINNKISKENDPIYTSSLGDDDTKVMVVAEAPSASGGHSVFISGKFDSFCGEQTGKSPLQIVKQFVKENYHGTIPYFTDVIKCGVFNQNKENKKILKKRASYCIDQFLLKEIEIINPEIILCFGNTAYNALNGKYRAKCIKLLHYGRNANLNLSDNDKKNIVWKIQAGHLKADSIKLSDLESINKLIR